MEHYGDNRMNGIREKIETSLKEIEKKKKSKTILHSFAELENIKFADLYCDCNNQTISDADNGL